MLAKRRQSVILAEIRRSGSVRVGELSTRFGVSDMTIRRDLSELARLGLVEKVHGGALQAGDAGSVEPGFEAKTEWEPEAKDEIAQLASGLVRPGTAIALSAGTTTHALARHLLRVQRLTVVTNSVRVADVFEEARRPGRTGPTVVLTGGVRTPSDALVGPMASLALHDLHVDQLFMGCHGLDPEAGLTTPNLAEAETNRALIACAGRVVVLADHSKWGMVSLSSYAPLSAVDTLITDAAMPPEVRELAAAAVGRLLVGGQPA
ncbi:DeoR/GlpR family transcriptional regulator of sugar metabolism [Streptacidiphilus sp. MAP12-20]|uniref:DeoR/GlpR family DNA-binding transcription regulator n=1 Tax=Streptacidiphilus sp. MAP12-20 TaxID=3156299 RepID=UPI0035183071